MIRVRGLRRKKWRGVEGRQQPAWPCPSGSGPERSFNDGYVRDVPTQGRTGRELDQMPSLGRLCDFSLALLRRVPPQRERTAGRKCRVAGKPQRLNEQGHQPSAMRAGGKEKMRCP